MSTTSPSQGYTIQDDTLMHQLINPFTKEVHVRPFIPSELRTQMILACHNDLKGAHYSHLRTHATLMPHAFWPDMITDIRKIIRTCEQCRRFGNRAQHVAKEHHLTSEVPGSWWVIDILHMPESHGFKYLLTMVDVCTRWGIAEPMQALDSTQAAIAASRQWGKAGVHFRARRLSHDGGSEFKGFFEDMCAAISKIHQHVSLHDRPAGHGIVERFNRELTQTIGKLSTAASWEAIIAKEDSDWIWAVQPGVDTHNASIHASTRKGMFGITPSEAMHGLRPALWNATSESELEDLIKCTHPGSRQHVQAIAHARSRALELIKETKLKYQQQLQQEMHKVTARRSFSIGEIVRVNHNIRDRKPRKTTPTRSAMRVIVKILGYGNYATQLLGNTTQDVVEAHADDIITADEASEEQQRRAVIQGADTNTEFIVDEIRGERGTQDDKEYLVKCRYYPEPEW